ncbi:MAG: chromosome segregation protein SMC [Gammaproteobacteria bacterium]
MRLSKIKMSGFKSFVDPTSIQFPSNLVGIVGPNGCGKSNIIDAVRWVMGELSAKQLRGDSMADVIFNGSSARKPVSAASIELIFDNSDGAVGGQFANYAEISVKREVVRDGTSNYFINNTRCRRRDVTDLFLGTGLGPRSYAIIEQGTISRLVESKPEELRVFLEEAAGISRYKERRRETENRIHHTRENIERLNDLLEEVNKQLQHLNRQARAAERYKELNDEKRRLEAELKVLFWRELDAQVEGQDHGIREQETQFEAALAEQRNIESKLEKARQHHDQAGDNLNAVQGHYYELGTAIARLEQSLQHIREQRSQQQKDTEELEDNRSQIQGHIERDQNLISKIAVAIAEHEPAYKHAVQKEQQATAALAAIDNAIQEWQQQWEEFNRETAEYSKSAEIDRTHIEHLDRQLVQILQRRDKLLQERDSISDATLQGEITAIKRMAQEADASRTQRQTDLDHVMQALENLRDEDQRLTQELHSLRSALEDHRGRLASLEALQQAALGKSRTQITEWLKKRGLIDNQRLAELITVAPGWERAVETVLGYHLEAVCVDAFDKHAAEFTSLTGGSLSFVEKAVSKDGAAGSLLSKINSPVPLSELLGEVWVAESLENALAQRSRLSAGESVITRDGIWLGRHWARIIRDQDERAGVIAREQDIKKHKAELATVSHNIEMQTGQLDQIRQQIRKLEERREQTQAEVNLAHRRQAEAVSQLETANNSLEQLAQHIKRLDKETRENNQQIGIIETELKATRKRMQSTLDSMQSLESRRPGLLGQRGELRNESEIARSRAKIDAEAVHTIALKLESQRSLLESTQQNLSRMQMQLAQMENRRSGLIQAAQDAVGPARQYESELKGLLNKRSDMDSDLMEARRKLETFAEQARDLEQQRHACERKAEELREQVQQLRLGTQEARVRRETLVEQMQQDGYVLEELLKGMPEDANPELWKGKIANVEQRIERLGPINLAAIQEFSQYSERKQYLDSQLADLNEALNTLGNAIRKIDRETRTRFKETFDKVNTGLQTSFPKLFGGGHAYLELTGEELLDAGVTLMARPPGKRNSTIQLLSGGEKALAAVALVFAIFELNPAPFCMLDEVDAPMDEANISRFGDLVRGMTDRVQFVFITHNKGTMEMANQLIGVTMQEPGVSRLVAVDVDEAVRIAAM